MTLVTLHDGRQVESDHEDWRHECEAREYLRRFSVGDRSTALATMEKRRGLDARLRLERDMRMLEPAFVLDLPDREARRAYLDRTEYHLGELRRNQLESEVKALWAARKAAA